MQGGTSSCISKVVRGTITFSSSGTKTDSFSPSIDPSKSLVIIPDRAVLTSISGTIETYVTVVSLASSSLTIRVGAIVSSGSYQVGYQIIEYL